MSNSKCNCSFEGELNNQECDTAFWKARCEKAEAEVALLKGETYCAYCGERFPLDAPDSCEQIGNHIQVCHKHPMRAVEAQRDAALEEVQQLKAHTWEQEWAAVVALAAGWIDAMSPSPNEPNECMSARCEALSELICIIERGEHRSEGGEG